jgi:2-oxoglutarate dehydrogenase complex dehydrogenase (E1) component-like enzyme
VPIQVHGDASFAG